MSIQKMILPILSLTLAVGLGTYFGSSYRHSSSQANQSAVMRTYQMAPGKANEAASTLERLFDKIEGASAKSFGDHTLVVTVPGQYANDVDNVVEQFSKNQSTNNQRIKMDYWVVRGSNEAPLSNDNNKSLKSLEIPLGSISENDGKQNYQILEHLKSNSTAGHEVTVKGWLSEAKSFISQDDQNINLNIEFETRFGRIRSRTKIKDGEFIVLGQSAVSAHKYLRAIEKHSLLERVSKQSTDNPKALKMSQIYYIIKASVAQ